VNVDGWANQDLANKFVQGGWKWARRAVQREDIGNLATWMTKPTARLILQFRTFSLVAWNKQLLYGLQMRDFNVFKAWALSSFFGSLGYITLNAGRAIGRDDADEFLRRRFSPSAIGSAAFQRAGFSSLLPGIVDSGMYMTGLNPWFAYGRTSGLATDIFTGNPTIDLIDSGWMATRGLVAGSINPNYQFSQEDMRHVSRIVPFANSLGILNVLNAIGGAFPKRSEINEE
jgi:hypothetical protein